MILGEIHLGFIPTVILCVNCFQLQINAYRLQGPKVLHWRESPKTDMGEDIQKLLLEDWPTRQMPIMEVTDLVNNQLLPLNLINRVQVTSP